MILPEPFEIEAELPAATWLRTFIHSVRHRDYKTAEDLFSPDTVGFGTIAISVAGLHELTNQQWKAVWDHTRDFTILPHDLRMSLSRDGSMVVLTGLWTSHTNDCQSRLRSGRCTIVLTQSTANPIGLVAIHTHFSKDPDGSL